MKLTLILLLSCIFTSSAFSQKLSKSQIKRMNKATHSLFKGQCNLENIAWMKVTEGYDKNAVLALAAEISAAAKADANQIAQIAEGKGDVKASAKFDETIKKISSKEVEVSKEFFELYQKMRAPICNIYTSVQSGFFDNSPELLLEAQKSFIEMNQEWLKYTLEEEKKSPH
ncbi:hypothetical protein SAMN04488511_11432 [Pedobacter suwonensis]|uniref:DUF4142 domain-containing protein n=1 Tax=Pedobacter suwonensis TaxID=332999 RepID=A0A1I0TSS2_9SPHI|nr:hypothetical protein [Pedobacter suwonensis]SFA54871.1 hypothetical protein SAMN04488511_11432 [Pedobacter suwonensis]